VESAGEADSRSLSRADVAREVNSEIRKVARALTDPSEADTELIFYCECGCLSPLQMTLAALEATGVALLDGHSRPDEES
jgi:hypothetical protein